MGLLTSRNPLACPGGLPGFNPGHFVLGNAPAFSGVASGGTFRRLDSLTINATPSGTLTGSIDGTLGPVILPGTSASQFEFVLGLNIAGSVNGLTLAYIGRWNTALGLAVAIGNISHGVGIGSTASNSMEIYVGSTLASISTSGIAAVNDPVMCVGSVTAAGASVMGVLNLRTGVRSITTASGTNVLPNATSNFYVGNYWGSNAAYQKNIAAATIFTNYISPATVARWFNDPWGFWYPQPARTIMALAGKASAVAYTQTVAVSGASALTAVKQVAPVRSWTTASALTAVKSAGKVLSWTTASALSALTQKAKLATIAISGSSAVSVVKQAGKVAAISGSSAVSAIKQAGKVLSWTTTSALTALAQKAHLVTVAISGSSALTVTKQVGKVLSWTTTSALTAVKSAGKKVAISAGSAVSVLGSHIVPQIFTKTLAIGTSGALAVVKAVSITLAGLSDRITDDGNIRITDDGNIRITDTPGSATSSTVSVLKARGRVIAIASASVVRIIFGSNSFSRVVTISTTSALRMTKTVSTAIAIAVSSAVSIATVAGITTAQMVTIAASSAVALVNQVGKVIAIATTSVDAIAIVKAVGITKGGSVVTFIGTSSVSVVKAVSKTLGWNTVGAVVTNAIKATTVAISITCSSVVTIFPALIRGVLIIIETNSVVSLTEALLGAGRATITLVGNATRVVLYGIRSHLRLIGQPQKLELTGMAREQDGTFRYGTSWIINGIARDDTGATLDLTGAIVQLRVVTVNPNAVVLDLATPASGSITNPTAGLYSFVITPDQQTTNNMTLNGYNYEVRATLNDGSVVDLNVGEITVLPSKFVNFP
jgi:hypothetical protein